MLKCENFDELVDLVKHVPVYNDMFEHITDPNVMLKTMAQGESKTTLEDLIFEEQVKMFMNSYFSQFHFGCFYSFLKLKEQESKDQISQGMVNLER